MHREIYELLQTATGDSEHVIVINADVRGFTAFSERVESVQAALYVQRIYQEMLSRFYADASYFKPTGDGLVVVYRFEPDTLVEFSRAVVRSSLRLVEQFANLCGRDPMLNFSLPSKIGIGIARGAATRLVAEDGRTLDYSGRPLNLAARLMDLARPEGIVFDHSFRPEDVLTPTMRGRFETTPVYIRSIAEANPIPVYFSRELTVVPESARRPIDRLEWEKLDTLRYSFKELQEAAGARWFRLQLPSRPIDTSQIRVDFAGPSRRSDGSKHPTMRTTWQIPASELQLVEIGDETHLRIDYEALVERGESNGMKGTWPVAVDITYPRG